MQNRTKTKQSTTQKKKNCLRKSLIKMQHIGKIYQKMVQIDS